jgi:hypothetical protein
MITTTILTTIQKLKQNRCRISFNKQYRNKQQPRTVVNSIYGTILRLRGFAKMVKIGSMRFILTLILVTSVAQIVTG